MYTLQELRQHEEVLEDLISKRCVCVNDPDQRDQIIETLQVVHAMLAAVTTQLDNQSISFTP
jgi:hypothetical protein